MQSSELAVLGAELNHTNRRIDEMQNQAEQRRKEQQQDTRAILAELSKLRVELESGKGFSRGVKFSVSVFWALTGGAAVAALAKLFG